MTQGLSRFAWDGLLAVVLLSGCAGARPSAERPRGGDAKAEALESSTLVVSPHEVLSVEELILRGDRQLAADDFSAAKESYKTALDHATHQEERLRALFGWGTALDLAAEPNEALRAYSRYVSEAPAGPKRDEAAVRQVRLLVYLERYQEAAQASGVISLTDRSPLQQLALLGARAHGLLADRRYDEAERVISRGRSVIDAHSLDRVAVPPLDVATLYLALGDLRAARAEEIQLNPVPPDFLDSLERRCQFILDAQGAYSEAMRSQDAHYSSMSGVKVGQLYKSLHSELMSIEAPPAAISAEKKQLFEGAMRLRYSILLRKSLAMMEATVALLDRTEGTSPWRDKAREALREIRAEQKAEEAAINALPYSRSQLQQVLDEMAHRATQSFSGRPPS
jgi:tetratricopeptide (TPR) repeat protein